MEIWLTLVDLTSSNIRLTIEWYVIRSHQSKAIEKLVPFKLQIKMLKKKLHLEKSLLKIKYITDHKIVCDGRSHTV